MLVPEYGLDGSDDGTQRRASEMVAATGYVSAKIWRALWLIRTRRFLMATAICDVRKDQPDNRMDSEEAKQIAKCIVEALTDAGLQIVPISKN